MEDTPHPLPSLTSSWTRPRSTTTRCDQQRMRAAEALAIAAAEGLTLARKEGTAFGFWGVSRAGSKFKAQVRALPGKRVKSDARQIRLGSTFECPEEAALALARKYPGAAAALAQQQARSAPAPMTQDEVEQAAQAEGLTLVPNASAPTGYHGVAVNLESHSRPYRAQLPGRDNRKSGSGGHVGYFASAHEAALAIARKLGPHKSAEMARQRRNCAGWEMIDAFELTSETARRIAAEEGLSLRRKHKSGDFWGVHEGAALTPRWIAQIPVGPDFPIVEATQDCASSSAPHLGASLGDTPKWRSRDRVVHNGHKAKVCKDGTLYLGSHASAEAAALTVARRLRDDHKLLASVTKLQQEAKTERQAHGSGRHAVGYDSPRSQSKRRREESSEVDAAAIEVLAVECWSDEDDTDAVTVEAQLVAD